MRSAFAVLCFVSGLTWGTVHAQATPERVERDAHSKDKSSSKGHTVGKDSQPPKGQPSAAQQQQRKLEEERRLQRRNETARSRPREPRALERTPGQAPPDHRGHTVSKDSQPPKGRPSAAQQMQDGQQEDDFRTVQCTAYPVCGGGGYGVCQGVRQTYTASNLGASRRDIVRQCELANTPDSCNCASQCRSVARCNIF